MEGLGEIKAVPKTGEEKLMFGGKQLDYSLIDFWRWSVSDILSNATRGRFAEFVVGTALGLKPEAIRDEWDAFDLITATGVKIEVKSASYIQSWFQRKFSSISFSIKLARYWDSNTNLQRSEPQRHADVYVFCLLKEKDQQKVNPLILDQWEFYVVPTITLDNYKRSKHSITLNSLKKLADATNYPELCDEVSRAAAIQANKTG